MTGVLWDFRDAGVLVTGAAGLLGRAVVGAFARAGAHVLATDRRDGFEAISDLDNVRVLAGDLTDDAFLDDLIADSVRGGSLDVVVNCAAVVHQTAGFLSTTGELFDVQYAVNLRALHGLSVRAARHWVEHQQSGAIVNFSSPGAVRAHADQSLYDATKGGVEALSRAMAVELGPYGIRVNCVSPASLGSGDEVRTDTPLGTSVRPADVADAVLFLSSSAAERITGQVLAIDAGVLAALRVRAH